MSHGFMNSKSDLSLLLVSSELNSCPSNFTRVRRTSSLCKKMSGQVIRHVPPKLKSEINEDSSNYFLWERMSVCTLFVLLEGFI